jgi:hypothetical protein
MIRFIAVVAALISVIGTIQVASAEYLATCHGPGNCTHQSCRQTSLDAGSACLDVCTGGQIDSVVQTDCFGRPSKRE